MRLMESYFPEYWKVSFLVPVFKNIQEKFVAKKTTDHPVSFLSVVSEIF